jgi:hypothetical protein
MTIKLDEQKQWLEQGMPDGLTLVWLNNNVGFTSTLEHECFIGCCPSFTTILSKP